MSTEVNTFLSFFNREKIGDSEEELFSQLDTYLRSEFSSLPLYILSFPIASKSERKHTRLHWNKKKFDGQYNVDLSQVLENIDYQSLMNGQESYCSFKDEKSERMNTFVPIGAKDKQFLIAGFSTLDKGLVENETIFSLFNYHIKTSFRYFEAIRREKKLSSLAHTDDVTGLFNQRKLNDDLVDIIKNSKKREQEFSLIFIDLDHFKDINDNYGHRIGSLLLKEMAEIFRKTLRDTDLIYRYGGDEFIIIIPNSDVVNDLSLRIGERLLENIKNEIFSPEENLSIKLSASLGVADFPKHAQTKEQIIEMADKMMYFAKKKGRGIVCHASKLLED